MYKANDSWYWTEHVKEDWNHSNIIEYSMITKKKNILHSFESVWYSDNNKSSYWPMTFSNIGIYNDRIYFNTSSDIKSINLEGKNIRTVYDPKLKNSYVYGMRMIGSEINFTSKSNWDKKDNITTITLNSTADSTGIKFNGYTDAQATTKVGETVKLKPSLTPSASKDYIYYTSTNPSIATADKSGVVTGKSKGTCKIYGYTQTGVFAVCTVTVK